VAGEKTTTKKQKNIEKESHSKRRENDFEKSWAGLFAR
jgi:hypothetical protein